MIPSIWPALDAPGERDFRESRRGEETRRLTVLVLVVTLAMLSHVPLDLAYGETRTGVASLLGLRGLVVLIGLTVLVVARSGADHRVRDRATVGWVLVFVIADVFAASTRPPDYLGYIALTPLIVLALYTIVPAPPSSLVGAAALETVGKIVAVSGSVVARPTVFNFVLALAIAHAIGVTAMWSLHRLSRDEFMALRAEQETRAELEQAAEEIRTLRGILPICSSCKKIRDDEGAWQQMEEYVSERSEAQFSHGICPSCSKELYGEP